MKILIVHTAKRKAADLQSQFREFGWTADSATDTDMIRYHLAIHPYAAVIIHGGSRCAEFVQKIRSTHPRIPLLIVTQDPFERFALDDMSWCDYIREPYSFKELTSKLLLLTYEQERIAAQLRCKHLTLDIATKQVQSDSGKHTLPKKELQILECLLRHKNQVVTRSQLYDYAWEFDEDPLANSVDVHISRLRKRFGRDLISTIHGFGYMLSDAS